MDNLKIELNNEVYYFRKYGNRMFQECKVFLNDKYLKDYKLYVNFYMHNDSGLLDTITFDNYNYDKSLQSRGIGTKVFDMLFKFYTAKGFNKFALVVRNDYIDNVKQDHASKNIARKLGYTLKEERYATGGTFTLDYFYKTNENNFILEGKDEWDKEQYFRSLGGNVITAKFKLKPLKLEQINDIIDNTK